jgi:hypothetical protein
MTRGCSRGPLAAMSRSSSWMVSTTWGVDGWVGANGDGRPGGGEGEGEGRGQRHAQQPRQRGRPPLIVTTVIKARGAQNSPPPPSPPGLPSAAHQARLLVRLRLQKAQRPGGQQVEQRQDARRDLHLVLCEVCAGGEVCAWEVGQGRQ